MIKEKRQQHKKRKIGLMILGLILGIVIIAVVLIYTVFTVKKVTVTGNELYDDETIKSSILNDQYSWNTLYVYLKYKFCKPEEIPFIDTMEISMTSVHSIRIKVYEKGIVGYVKVKSTGQNAYFDKDGIVVEVSTDTIEDAILVKGITFDEVTVYEELPVQEKSIFKDLLSLSHSLKKYKLVPESIAVSTENHFVLTYGTVKVIFGDCQQLNEKVVRLEKIMPEIKDLKGTLHMEEWTDSQSDITFEKTKQKNQ